MMFTAPAPTTGVQRNQRLRAYKNLGHFNEGVMKGADFERPKHGAVTYLTADELRAAAQYWKVDIKKE
jgi:hypothetical protein